MIYLTWGTGYTGVFASQVIGAVKYYSELSNKSVLLISFVPYTIFFDSKRKIKRAYKYSLVFPMIPSRNHWFTYFTPLLAAICIFFNERKLIARGSIACNIALILKKYKILKWVCYDGRGAQKAEYEEYKIGQGQKVEKLIPKLESNAVLKSDLRLAVSQKLLEYWKNEYGYQADSHVIIPCTVDEDSILTYESNVRFKREQYGYDDDDIIVVFSGGADLWQSFEELDGIANNLLDNNPKVKLLFLSNAILSQTNIFRDYPERIKQMWLEPGEVLQVLLLCDYGVLYRHYSVTNSVSSPTKFAEYLAAGLQVLISKDIGDYSALVLKRNLGFVIEDITKPIYLNVNERQNEIQSFAIKSFTKNSFKQDYLKIIKFLS